MNSDKIYGYEYGSSELEESPVTIEDLNLLKQTLLWSNEDDQYLKMAGSILIDQIDQILDLWYGYVGNHKHLLYYFTKDDKPITEYLNSVRKRFGQWIIDLCSKNYDQDWLNYQYEIAKRHHLSKKNVIDGVNSVPFVHFRYMVAFIFPITITIKSFLSAKNNTPEEVEKMYNAWFKAVTLSVILWSYPYIREGQF